MIIFLDIGQKKTLKSCTQVSSGLNGAQYVTAGSNMHSHKAQNHCVPNGLKKRGKLGKKKKKKKEKKPESRSSPGF